MNSIKHIINANKDGFTVHIPPAINIGIPDNI